MAVFVEEMMRLGMDVEDIRDIPRDIIFAHATTDAFVREMPRGESGLSKLKKKLFRR